MSTPAYSSSNISKPTVHRRIEALAARLRRRQLIGSREVALEVIRLVRDVVSSAKYNSFDALVEHLEEVGKALQEAGPKELVVTNMTRRIVMLLSEEYATALSNYLSDTSHANRDSTDFSSDSDSDDHVPAPMSVPQTPAPESLPSGSGNFFSGGIRAKTGQLGSLFELLGHSKDLNLPAATPRAASGGRGASTGTTTPTSPAPSSPSSSGILVRPNLPVRTSSVLSPVASSSSSSNPHLNALLETEFSRKSHSLKPVFIDAISELMDEVDFTYRSVGEQSIDHIHSGEVILTIGQSKTVEAFLKAAARKRKFTVIVAETAPSFSGRATALSLSSSGINTILIPDSNLFAILPRCTKVLLGPHLILADGALLSISGSLPLCVAASHLRVPVVVVGGMFKFCPVYLGDADWGMRDLGSPEEVLWRAPGGEGKDEVSDGEEETEVLNPYFDVVPAELVDLYITNLGGHPSSLLYRLLSETYGAST